MPRLPPLRPAFRSTLRRAIVCMLASALPAAAADEIAADAATAARLLAHHQAFQQLTSVQADVLTQTAAPGGQTSGRVVLRGTDAYHRVDRITPDGERTTAQESVVTADTQVTVNYDSGVATRVDLRRLREAAPALTVPNSATDMVRLFAAAVQQ